MRLVNVARDYLCSCVPYAAKIMPVPCRESVYASEGCAAVSALKLVSCVASAIHELPVWDATEVETEALGLLQLCR